MSEVKALFGKFLEIQKEQNDLLEKIAGKMDAQQFWEASISLGTHKRDCHNRYWDPSIAVEARKGVVSDLTQLRQQYKQNQERLDELRKQLFAEVF